MAESDLGDLDVDLLVEQRGTAVCFRSWKLSSGKLAAARAGSHPRRRQSEIAIESDDHNGLMVRSAAQCQHLRAVSTERIVSVRGNVGAAKLAQIRETIEVLLDISV